MKKEIIETSSFTDRQGKENISRDIKHWEVHKVEQESKIKITVSKEYTLPISARVVIDMPRSCYDCPCGFGSAEDTCGRNIPWTYIDSQERPSTCKLRTLEQYLKENNM